MMTTLYSCEIRATLVNSAIKGVERNMAAIIEYSSKSNIGNLIRSQYAEGNPSTEIDKELVTLA